MTATQRTGGESAVQGECPVVTEQSPWFKFWRQKWLGNYRLRACSPAARALLVDLMAMSDGDGIVRAAVTVIANSFGASVESVEPLLLELAGRQILNRRDDGLIVMRAIAKEYWDRKHGKRGGRPGLKKRGGSSQNTGSGLNHRREKREVRVSETLSDASHLREPAVPAGSDAGAPKPPRPEPAHNAVGKLFQIAWAHYRHADQLKAQDFTLTRETDPSTIPPEFAYPMRPRDWKAACEVWSLARGDLDLIRERMRNLFLSEAQYAGENCSLPLFASKWPQLEQPLNGLFTTKTARSA